MLHKYLLKPEIQKFIREHEKDDPARLMLKRDLYPDLPLPEIIEQIKGRQKAKSKLPRWYGQEGLFFPPLALEQCSSETTAAWKARQFSGTRALDLSGGFGVDTYFWSRSFEQVNYVEANEALKEQVAHNLHQLGARNIAYYGGTALSFLEKTDLKFDLTYLDPSRRDSQGQKVFRLADTAPNILEILPRLLEISPRVVLKAAPFLDIRQGIEELASARGNVDRVFVLAVQNEVKEILFSIKKDYSDEPVIEAIDIRKDIINTFDFQIKAEKAARINFQEPGPYIIEPNAAILKAGAFKSFAQRFDLAKLHPSSHLYTCASWDTRPEIPGRVFRLMAISPYRKKNVLRLLEGQKAHIRTRNFPDSVAQIRKKLQIREGGDQYIFATQDIQNKWVLLICKKAD